MATDEADLADTAGTGDHAGVGAGRSWLYDTAAGAALRRVVVGLTTLVLGVFILFPLYWMVVTAFKTTA
jgi:ABC-type glycerol-3-phosphate transport system permease component